MAVVSHGHSVSLWRTADWHQISERAFASEVSAVTLSRRGEVFVVGMSDGEVRVLDTNGRRERVVGRHLAAVRALQLSETGEVVLSGSDDRTARVWDVVSSSEMSRISLFFAVRAVALLDEQRLTASGDNYIWVGPWSKAAIQNAACGLLRSLAPHNHSQFFEDFPEACGV